MRLNDRVAIITGPGQGIGKATALLFAREGSSVIVADINDAQAEATAREITSTGGKALAVKTNVANVAETEQLVPRSIEAFGRVHILIDNAGITRDATLLKMTDDQFNQVIDVNLRGVSNTTRGVARIWLKLVTEEL